MAMAKAVGKGFYCYNSTLIYPFSCLYKLTGLIMALFMKVFFALWALALTAATPMADTGQASFEAYLLRTNAQNQASWNKISNNIAKLPFNTQHSLIKVHVNARQSMSLQFLLEIAGSDIQSLDVYRYDFKSASLIPLYTDIGIKHRYANRPNNYRNPAIPINFKDDKQQTFLLHVEHGTGQKLQLKLWPNDVFSQKVNRELIFFGMIYGALLMIVIYNLFVYLSLGEKNHLWFFLFGGFTGLFISLHEGHFLQFIGTQTDWPKDFSFAIVSALMCFSFSLFSSYFLNLQKHSAILNRVLLSAGSTAAAIILLLGISQSSFAFSPYTLFIILLLYSIGIGIGLSIWYTGIASAGFYALAIFLCSVGFFAEFISGLPFNQLQYNVYSLSSVGNTAMLFVFAFALADKMRVLNKEKLAASLKLVQVTEEKARSSSLAHQRKLTEVQLKQEAQAAVIQAQAKNEFLTTMGHEVRTPMSGVLGMTELLADTKLNQEQQSYVESIKNSANALLNVINGLLDFSRVEAGNVEVDSRLFHLDQLIDGCIDIFALNSREKSFSFTAFVLPNTPLQLKGDAEKIKQITLGLLNSLAQIKGVDRLLLTAGQSQKKSVNSIELLFTIDIHGENIEQESIEHWLSQLDDSPDGKNQAQQINMAIFRQLLELMNGDLSFKLSEHGFTLQYTARLLTPKQHEMEADDKRSQIFNNRQLLVCHENPDIIAHITSLSSSWGMHPSEASDSETLIAKLNNKDTIYHTIIIASPLLSADVQLAIRQNNVEQNFNSTIIAINDDKPLSPEDMRTQGIQAALQPPFTSGELYKTLTQSMGIDAKTDTKDKQFDLKVLVAEDNDINLMVLEGLLKKLSIHCDVARNGQQAVDKAEVKQYDLIFMDCEMPELDGYQATTAIRKLEQQESREQTAVIIGLSAHTDGDYKSRAEDTGMDDFLAKPINGQDIEVLLQQFFANEQADWWPKFIATSWLLAAALQAFGR